MDKPIPEMKYNPNGEEYLFPAWFDLVNYAVTDELFVSRFKEETDIDILDVINQKGINAMIDEATGYQKEAVVKWCDWVTLNLWGVGNG